MSRRLSVLNPHSKECIHLALSMYLRARPKGLQYLNVVTAMDMPVQVEDTAELPRLSHPAQGTGEGAHLSRLEVTWVDTESCQSVAVACNPQEMMGS